jgi:ankyrin repeat protein
MDVSKDYTPISLVQAVQWGDLSYVETAVEVHGLSPNCCDSDGCSLLHWAAINNRVSIMKYLVSKNASVNIIGGANKEIPLQWALRSTYCTEMVNLLLAEGAQLSHRSIYGCDALLIAVQCRQVNAVFILLNAGADPNTRDIDGNTPLYWMLRKCDTPYNTHPNCIDILRLLISFKASVSYRSADGNNALHILASNVDNFDEVWAHLIYMAAEDNRVLETKNNENMNPRQVRCRLYIYIYVCMFTLI